MVCLLGGICSDSGLFPFQPELHSIVEEEPILSDRLFFFIN